MTTVYQEAQQLALELLEEFGRDIEIVRLARGAGTVDLVAGTVQETEEQRVTLRIAILPASGGTLEAFDVRFLEGVGAETDVRFGIASALDVDGLPITFTPKPGDRAEFDGRSWAVMGNTPLNVDGTPVTFNLGFRGL